MTRLVDAARVHLEAPAFVVLAVVAGGAAGVLGATSAGRVSAVIIGSVLLIAVTAYRPVFLAVIALIGVFASQRVGSTALVAGNEPGVSYSDALLAAATLMSMPALVGARQLRRLRLVGGGVAIYLGCLLPTLLLNWSQRGYLEWLHRLVLLGGSLLVGAWIAREGKIRPALRLLTLVACVLALATVANAVRYGFAHAAPFGLNKNFVGGQLAAVFILVFIARDEVALPAGSWTAVAVIIGGGVIASHSRGGALAATVGLFLALVLQRRLHRPSTRWLAVLAGIVLALFVYVSVRGQLNHSQTLPGTSSLGIRFNVERVTRQIWRTSPVYGVGLKYFNTHAFGPLAVVPNNIIDNELAESGVIGLAGFVVLQAAVFSATVRRGRTEQLAAAAFGMVAGLLAHGMVDIYWIAGSVTLPFIAVGMALAREPSDQIRRHPRTGSRRTSASAAVRRRGAPVREPPPGDSADR